jgi:hypothetical protein
MWGQPFWGHQRQRWVGSCATHIGCHDPINVLGSKRPRIRRSISSRVAEFSRLVPRAAMVPPEQGSMTSPQALPDEGGNHHVVARAPRHAKAALASLSMPRALPTVAPLPPLLPTLRRGCAQHALGVLTEASPGIAE